MTLTQQNVLVQTGIPRPQTLSLELAPQRREGLTEHLFPEAHKAAARLKPIPCGVSTTSGVPHFGALEDPQHKVPNSQGSCLHIWAKKSQGD